MVARPVADEVTRRRRSRWRAPRCAPPAARGTDRRARAAGRSRCRPGGRASRRPLMCVSARPRSNSYMPESKMPLTVKRLHARHEARGRRAALGRHEHHACRPLRRASSAASALPRMMRILAGLERFERALAHAAAEAHGLHLFFRQDAAHHGAGHALAVGEQPARFDERHHGDDAAARCAASACASRQSAISPSTPVMVACEVTDSMRLRSSRLEAVQHRQHHDEHRHAEREADHRHRRDERHEAAAMRGAQVARADEPFVGRSAIYSYRSASAGGMREARNAG